jgi:hypothetical protein
VGGPVDVEAACQAYESAVKYGEKDGEIAIERLHHQTGKKRKTV